MKKEEVISILRENLTEIRKFGVKRIGIFGSVARNEADENSDIDFIVEFERGKATFENFGGLIEFLENLFKKEVDVLTLGGVRSIRIKSIREKIEQEIEYV